MPAQTSYISVPQDEEEDTSANWGMPVDPSMAAPGWNELNPPPPVAQVAQPVAQAAPPAAAPANPYAAPVYNQPDRAALDEQWAKMNADQKPLDRNSAALKPKWWERLAGGFGAGMIAAGGGGSDTAIRAGQGVVNRRYDRAEADRQRNIQADQTGINAAQGSITAADQAYDRTLRGYIAQGLGDQRQANADMRRSQEQQRLQSIAPGTAQPDDPKNPMGSWHATTVEGKPIAMTSPPDSWLKTPQGKIAATTAEREQMARSIGAKPGGEDYKYIMANGKLREPNPNPVTNIRIPSAESETYNDWKRSLGHPPSAQEIIEYKRGNGRGGAGGGQPTNKQVSDLVLKRNVDYQKVNDNFGEQFKSAKTKEEQDALTQEHAAALSELNQKYDDAFSALDPTGNKLGDTQSSDARPQAPAVPQGAAVQPAAAPAPQPSPTAPPAVAAPKPAAAVPSTAAPATRTLKDSKGNTIQAIVVDGKWVDSKTKKPL